ncbi:type VI secretion system baseplate subunit TssF/IglH [Francisella philomiragia]|uniref:type VI secretion system baseplate subunit TssF/IglH n=1 Tax=Francisella philomiragia TaxID=28110 RepID=UPI0035157332
MKDNQFDYLLSNLLDNIKNELKENLDNYKRLLTLKLYGHLSPSLPERFLIKLDNINTTMQTSISPNTIFNISNTDRSKTTQAITVQEYDILPIKSVQTSIKDKRLIINIQLSQKCYLSKKHISLWLNPEYPKDSMYTIFNYLQNKPLVITLTSSNNEKSSQLSHFSSYSHSILPVNTTILDKLCTSNFYNIFRIDLKQLYLDNTNGYIKSIDIETDLPIMNLLKDLNINNLFCLNFIPLYNYSHDSTLAITLDSHHHQIALKPKSLNSDYKLVYPLSLYINKNQNNINQNNLYLDLDKQIIQYYPSQYNNNLYNKHLYIDGLWHRKILPDEYTKVNSNSIDANYKIVSYYNATNRQIDNNYDELLSCLNKIGYGIHSNPIQIIMCFLLTGQTDSSHISFKYWHNNFFFKKNKVFALQPKDYGESILLQQIYDEFVKTNMSFIDETNQFL